MKIDKHKNRTIVIKLVLDEFAYRELEGMRIPGCNTIQENIRHILHNEIVKGLNFSKDEEQ